MILNEDEFKQIYLDNINNISKVKFYKQFLIDVINNPKEFKWRIFCGGIGNIISNEIEELECDTLNKFIHDVIDEYLPKLGYKILDKKSYLLIEPNSSHIFTTDNNSILFIRQIFEDSPNHDNRQIIINNFIKDSATIRDVHDDKNVNGILWFVNETRGYVCDHFEQFGGCEKSNIYYGGDLSTSVIKNENMWVEIFNYTEKLDFRIDDDFLIVDFDNDPTILEALKEIDTELINKLKSDLEDYDVIRSILFPSGKALENIGI